MRDAKNRAEKTAEDLARSNQDLEQFAYVVSHDLQEPLRVVTMFLELLQNRYRDRLDATADEFIGHSVDGAQSMSRMIRDLLVYSRVGSQGLQPARVDLGDILDRALVNLRVAIDESKAVITHDPLPTVTADVSQMTQVFQNLIGNALKFRADDRCPEVHIGVRQENGVWVFQVKDNGIGIDPKQADRLFTLFHRLHDRSKYPGTGIGLAICKKIVERHGGRIWIESKAGEGSTFCFTLPEERPS
jgi:two-component system, chemotaxis family, sensor kinase Cph1